MLPLSQEACIVLPRVSRTPHAFEGVATDLDEQARLVESLAPFLTGQAHFTDPRAFV